MHNVAIVSHSVDSLPKYEAGATFETNRFYESRGAKVDPTDMDNLPTQKEYNEGHEAVWDQDYDGKPAMTTIIAGALNAEAYSDQIWSSVMTYEIVDENHIKGLNNHETRQYQLDGSSDHMIYDIETAAHEDVSRSYIRMKRLDKMDASCEDVMELAGIEDGWLDHTPHLDDITLDE